MNELIRTIIENCHKYSDKYEEYACKQKIKINKKKLIEKLKLLTNIKFYLSERMHEKQLFICAIRKSDVKILKAVIQKNNLNLYCSSLSFNQLIYYKGKALHNKLKKFKNNAKCGCYHCLANFDAKELISSDFEIFDDTFICPYCGENSVLFEKTNKKFLYEIELFVYGKTINFKNSKALNKFNVISLKNISID